MYVTGCSIRRTRRSTRDANAQVAGGVTAPRGGDRRRLPGRVHPRDGRRRTPASTRTRTTRIRSAEGDAVERRLRSLRDDHDGDARPARHARYGRRSAPARIWLTEYGYQSTRPTDCSASRRPCRPATSLRQPTRRCGDTARRHADPVPLPRRAGRRPLAERIRHRRRRREAVARAANAAAAQVSRRGLGTVVWGQVRRAAGGSRTSCSNSAAELGESSTAPTERRQRGFFYRYVRAGKGSKLRLWYPRDRVGSPLLTVR